MCVVQTRAAPPGAAGPWGEQDCPGQMIWYVFHKTGPTCTTCCREVLHDLQQHIPLCHFCIFALLPPSIPASALGHRVFCRCRARGTSHHNMFFFSPSLFMRDSEWNTGDESTEAQSLDTWSVKYLHDDGSLLLVGPFWVCPSL